MRIGFLYNAQDHHLFHSLPVAAELSRLFPEHEARVLARSAHQAALARTLADAYPGHRLAFERLAVPHGLFAGPDPSKLLLLMLNAARLDRFDALVTPERTSLHLRRMGVTRPRFIHTFHGSSGHDRAADPRLAAFDLLLAPSVRRLRRIAEAGRLHRGRVAVVGYVKLDLIDRLPRREAALFDNGRPVVVYNPHHRARTSSWPALGRAVLDHFAEQDVFNLVFAPHVRLFAGRPAPPGLAAYAHLPHIHVDLGSLASIDMTYLDAADVYLGDVSSQVMEFVRRPRPCVFLNPRRMDWRSDPDFANWRLGRVIERPASLAPALAGREHWQPGFERAQSAAAAEAFPDMGEPPPSRAARAIDVFLREGRLGPEWLTALPADAGERRRVPA
jgi:hypothetical protein